MTSLLTQIIGMNGVPNAGDQIAVVFDEAAAKETAESRKRLVKQAVGLASSATIMSNAVGFADGLSDNREVIKIPLLIKSDVLGSAEALRKSIEALQISDEAAICKADIIYSNVGDVTSSDVSITDAAKAKIIPDEIACVLLHLCFSVSNPRALWNHCKAFPLNGFWF